MERERSVRGEEECMNLRGGWSAGVGVARKVRRAMEVCEEERGVIVFGG